MTIAAWLVQWLDGHVAGSLSEKTAESYRQQLRDYVVPRLGHHRLTDLRAQHVQDYIAWGLAEGLRLTDGGLSRRTVQYHFFILGEALNDAVNMGLIAVNPCKAVTPPKPKRRDIPNLGPDSIGRLLDTLSETSYGTCYQTLLYTGLRRGEILALQWKDVDLDLACIYVSHSLQKLDDGTTIRKEPKTSRSRRRCSFQFHLLQLWLGD